MGYNELPKARKARILGVARSTLYYRKRKPDDDWELKCLIEETLREFPAYGYRRLSQHLSLNKKRVQRVMQLFGIKAYRRRGRRWRNPKQQTVSYPNLLMAIKPSYSNQVWVADFTYLPWRGRMIFVATVMDVYTREIVGVSVATTHTSALVTQALCVALQHHQRPGIFHSDNGVEYNAKTFREMLTTLGIQISRSKKGCPWENGYQESFYDKFKVELGDPNRYPTLGELVYAIYQTIWRYNYLRIHSALKMPPKQFAQKQALATMSSTV